MQCPHVPVAAAASRGVAPTLPRSSFRFELRQRAHSHFGLPSPSTPMMRMSRSKLTNTKPWGKRGGGGGGGGGGGTQEGGCVSVVGKPEGHGVSCGRRDSPAPAPALTFASTHLLHLPITPAPQCPVPPYANQPLSLPPQHQASPLLPPAKTLRSRVSQTARWAPGRTAGSRRSGRSGRSVRAGSAGAG